MAQVAHLKLEDDNQIMHAILPGDPARIDRIASYLENVEELANNREFRSIRGLYKGVMVLAVSTGIGGPSAVIAVEELASIGVKNMIRIGSCGAIQPGMKVGDLVLVTAAVRDEGTSKAYVPENYPAVADFTIMEAMKKAAMDNNICYHMGVARSHDSFYIDNKQEIYDYWKAKGVLASDMETAALYVVGSLRGVRCGSILNVVVGCKEDLQSQINKYSDGEDMAARGELNEILVALEALVSLGGKNG